MNRAAFRFASATLLAAAIVSAMGCEQLDARRANRDGNKAFEKQDFVEAASKYEKALKTVDDPKVHYNLGLAYKYLTKPGITKPIKLEVSDSEACKMIPGTTPMTERVCMREGDHRYLPCDSDKQCPTDEHHCRDTSFCSATSAQLADLSAQHFQKWLEVNPKDDDTFKLMTQVWVESEAYDAALKYWTAQHEKNPTDTQIMGTLAGISQKAGDWKTSIDWYRKVAEGSKDPAAKLAAYTYIGRVARAKLAGKTLSPADSIELADDGIGALQHAKELDPQNAATYGLMGAIWSLRSTVQGASFAGTIDRATSQDLLAVQAVLFKAAKAAEQQGLQNGSAAPQPAPTPTPKTGG